MSGAALFLDDYLIGVVSGDPVQWGHARVEAVPASVLIEDENFRQVIQGATGSQVEITEIRRQAPQSLATSRQIGDIPWYPVSEVEPITFGVHRAPDSPGHPQVVEYVPRGVDVELDDHLAILAREGGMLLLTGDSAAGKTRALFEAMRRNLADWLVCKPDPEASLSSLLSLDGNGQRIVWLDDLHDYLHSDGLTPMLLDALTSRRVVLLSTLRTEFHEHYTDDRDVRSVTRIDGPRISSSPGRVIRAARHITVDRIWTPSERRRASLVSDPRITEALNSDKSYGVAEYLAAGPQILKMWRSASRVRGNPRGAALVAAAVDLARTGVDSSLPADAVERLHEHYLEQAGGPALRPEGVDKAWNWATDVVLGVTASLNPGRGGTWKPFDYLVSDVARRSPASDLPDCVWGEALRVVDNSRRTSVAMIARVAGRPDVAKEVLVPLVEANDPDGLINLGALLASEEDYEGASRCFLQASELGDSTGTHNLGALCYVRDDLSGALQWYSLAVERGELQSIGALGLVYDKLGDQDKAVELWKRGTEAGDPASALHYSDWLALKFQSDESVEALRIAADGEIPFATLSYAGVLLRKKDHDQANVYVSKAYDIARKQAHLGDSVGALMAGVIAYSFGNLGEGKEWWDRARSNGLDVDWLVLEASPDFPGLRYLAVSREMVDKLGEEEIRLLMQILWAGDCLDCGYPLAGSVPALYVDDSYTRADARIFHFGLCRYPRWNDSALITMSNDVGISWKSVSAAFSVGDSSGGPVPTLIVNPSLERAQLNLDGEQGWTVTGVYGPQSVLGSALNLRPLWSGFPPRDADSLAWAFIGEGEVSVAAGHQVWSAPARSELVTLVEQFGGLLLILTSALGPEPSVSMDLLSDVLESWDSMARWVPLHNPSA
jgi:tetratricopeptide (TPR) repeat protein